MYVSHATYRCWPCFISFSWACLCSRQMQHLIDDAYCKAFIEYCVRGCTRLMHHIMTVQLLLNTVFVTWHRNITSVNIRVFPSDFRGRARFRVLFVIWWHRHRRCRRLWRSLRRCGHLQFRTGMRQLRFT